MRYRHGGDETELMVEAVMMYGRVYCNINM